MPDPATARHFGAHALLSALESRGVRYLFGVPGHGAYPIYDAINDFPSMQAIVGRHEQGITFAADAYAWVTNGVAVATSVPAAGLTNASTSILEATWSQDRLLFLLEEDPMHRDVLRSIARYYQRVDDAEEIGAGVHHLLDLLETGRPGAAVLEVPNRSLNTEVRGLPGAHRTVAATAPASATLVSEAAELLSAAPRCVIVAGATAVAAGASSAIQRLAEALGAPVFTDNFAKGVLSQDHPLALGHSWTANGPGEQLLRDADLILVIGAPVAAAQNTGDWSPTMVTGSRPPEQVARQLVLVDWDDQQQGPLAARLRLQGDVPGILEAMSESVQPRGSWPFPSERLDAIRQLAWDYAAERNGWALPAFRGLREALPRDAIVLCDSLIGIWLDWLFPAYGPRRMRFPCGTGTLGWGVPASVGAKLAAPDREVVVVAGDGAFLYNPQELATMLLYGQKVTVVIANDNQYSAIRHNMAENFGRSTCYQIVNPDFVRLGEAFGMRSIRLASSDDLGSAVAEAIAGDRSTLIDCPLEVLPPRALYDFKVGYAVPTTS